MVTASILIIVLLVFLVREHQKKACKQGQSPTDNSESFCSSSASDNNGDHSPTSDCDSADAGCDSGGDSGGGD